MTTLTKDIKISMYDSELELIHLALTHDPLAAPEL